VSNHQSIEFNEYNNIHHMLNFLASCFLKRQVVSSKPFAVLSKNSSAIWVIHLQSLTHSTELGTGLQISALQPTFVMTHSIPKCWTVVHFYEYVSINS
jgi:hypothetical protein